MKKHRKQKVDVCGVKRLVDVPVDKELYKADNRDEYQRARGKTKHVPFDEIMLAGFTGNVMEEYEEEQLKERLREVLLTLTDYERRLIELVYYDRLTEREAAKAFGKSHQFVNRKKKQIIEKLRRCLKDWL
jgi:RNA polymerase sigma factor (sigma-70 family)